MTYPQQQGPYGQQYGGYQHPGQHGGYGGPPPKKSNSTAIAIVIVVVAALAGLGITGFVAPGFFLGDDKKSADGGGGSGAGADNAGGGDSGADNAGGGDGIDEFANTLAAAANDQDKAALKGLTCADATENVDEATAAIGQTDSAKLADTTKVSDDEYIVVVTISYEGNSGPFAATVVKAENDWCWQDFAPGKGSTGSNDSDSAPSSGGDDKTGGGSADGEAVLQEFLDAINAKDAATAEGMICSDSPSNSLVDYVISKNPQLEIAGVDQSGSSLVSYELGGAVNGKPVTAGTASVRTSGSGSPCVYTFIA